MNNCFEQLLQVLLEDGKPFKTIVVVSKICELLKCSIFTWNLINSKKYRVLLLAYILQK